MSRRKEDKGRLPAFVPLLKETMQTRAWRALSHGARSLYVALKARYSVKSHNNGRLFISHRDAREELGGSGFDEIGRWFRELQHYGFIVMTKLKLTRFRGHRNICVLGVHNGEDKSTIYTGIPAPDGRAGARRSLAGEAGGGV